jgi:hypothetical protein
VRVSLSLPQALSHYAPRKCDCDFCVARNIAYLSVSEGRLEVNSHDALLIQRQGSKQGSFQTCQSCSTVIAVTTLVDDKLIGSLNAKLLDNFACMNKIENVSPKTLSAIAKRTRWKSLWMPTFINITRLK